MEHDRNSGSATALSGARRLPFAFVLAALSWAAVSHPAHSAGGFRYGAETSVAGVMGIATETPNGSGDGSVVVAVAGNVRLFAGPKGSPWSLFTEVTYAPSAFINDADATNTQGTQGSYLDSEFAVYRVGVSFFHDVWSVHVSRIDYNILNPVHPTVSQEVREWAVGGRVALGSRIGNGPVGWVAGVGADFPFIMGLALYASFFAGLSVHL